MRISDWSSDVCSSDLLDRHPIRRQQRDGVVRRMKPRSGTLGGKPAGHVLQPFGVGTEQIDVVRRFAGHDGATEPAAEEQLAVVKLQQIPHRSEAPTSELQSLMRNSYAVFRLTKKKTPYTHYIKN